jgi:histidinol dehydrogenase
MLLRHLDARAANFAAQLRELIAFDADQDAAIEMVVGEIVAAVRRRGDAALIEYTRHFDRLDVQNISELEIDAASLDAAWLSLDSGARGALEVAADRIRQFHERQRAQDWELREANGSRTGQIVTPLDSVGVYVPGGKAAYPSSVLMNAIPAQVAGVGAVTMVVPTPDGHRNPWVLAAARLAGVRRVIAVGGAQAIAALAYGTESIERVDKIVGPGNAYVAAAKRRVFGAVGIDMIAGPSEVVIIADASAHPDWIAMDLFAQAEHDELAQAILITPDTALAAAVEASIARQLGAQPRRDIIAKSLMQRGAIILAESLAQACTIANQIAPEHLELALDDARDWLSQLRHAGAIFVGHHSAEVLGDYCAGPNHVLPTSGCARFASPLGVYDFQKRTSLIDISAAAAAELAPVAARLARGEGLFAHASSAELRVSSAGAMT